MMNKAISGRIGMSLGSWQAILNGILLVLVLIFGGRNLGVGTVANMLLVGYSVDFFSWLWGKWLPPEAFESGALRAGVLLPALLLFIFSAAVYMAVDMGTSPYDAIPFILGGYLKKVPFRLTRIAYDFAVIGIACIFDGRVQIVTVLMALLLGPAVTWVGSAGSRVLPGVFCTEDSRKLGQKADNRQQITDSGQQRTGNKQQTTENRQQIADRRKKYVRQSGVAGKD